ncbi:MAG: imelysin family protein [Cellvibrionaceae bacterium]|nr:imelysin family protein [Cellvibrionaceae bacterium]
MMNFPLRKLFYSALFCASFSACVDNSRSPQQQQNSSAEDFDFLGMMANYADNIIVPNYQALSSSAEKLSAEDGVLATYCAAIDDSVTEVSEEVADAWLELQAAIQRSEMHILGPVSENSGGLLNRINSYNGSELSLCGIDQAVVLASQASDFDITLRTNNQRGVTALEYLLFDNSLTHHCPSQIPETADWNQRSAEERRQLRCNYAQIVSADIGNSAAELLQAWAIDGENYRLDFINPNNVEDNLSALSDALFYLDVDVKDRKLGIPTGINNEGCSAIACADAVESPFAEASLRHIRHNLESFAEMLTGGEGLGFDDIIRFAGVDELNSRMLTAVDDAIVAIDNMEVSLKQQADAIVTSEDEAACANALANPGSPSEQAACRLFGLIRRLTDDLKVDFVAAVNVDLPERGQADND